MVADKKGDTYEERLKSIGLTSLTERRIRGDMIETFKTIKGFNRVDKEKWFKFRNENNSRATRSTVSVSENEQCARNNVLFKENVRLDTRKYFFLVRVVDKWNEIPDEVKNQKTKKGFKDKYDEWNRSETARRQYHHRRP